MVMNYTLLMGRGIEGTGNTKYAVEFQEYLEKNGHNVITIANSDKKWGREKSHPNKIKLMSFSYVDDVYKLCKNADCVFVLSVPAKNYDWLSQDGFCQILEKLHDDKIKLVYIQVDHKMQSIKRNFYDDVLYTDVLEMFDIVFTHSKNSDFVKFCNDNDITLNKLICSSDLGVGEIFGLNFEKYRPIWCDNKDYKTIRFMGRSATWKGPWLVRDLHTKYFKDRGYITVLEGIEGSIGTVVELYKETKPERIPRDDVIIKLKTADKNDLNEDKLIFERNKPTYILPPYDNTLGMKRLAKSTFGIELLLLDDKILSDVYEYAMLEIVAVGTIPIFRKHWGEKFKINDTPLIELDTGIIFMDENNPVEALKQMNELSDNKSLYEQERLKVYDFFKRHFDSNVIFSKIMEKVDEV